MPTMSTAPIRKMPTATIRISVSPGAVMKPGRRWGAAGCWSLTYYSSEYRSPTQDRAWLPAYLHNDETRQARLAASANERPEGRLGKLAAVESPLSATI